MKKYVSFISLLLAICLLFSGCGATTTDNNNSKPSESISSITDTSESLSSTESESKPTTSTESNTKPPITSNNNVVSLSNIPTFSGKPYVAINNNVPSFSDSDLTTKSYEYYSELDRLGRCGVVIACVGQDLMPTEDRGSIGQVKPTGWHTVKYDCVDGKYLYNRCHLIGYQLSGENANTQNLITGTRYMNVDGMLPFENLVADYVKETDNHVLYRVTPIFESNNLLATGVQMEAYSVEDDGDGICFNVFVYNAQPQITINYTNGDSSYNGSSTDNDTDVIGNQANNTTASYIANKNTKKFHYPECSSVDRMKESNKVYLTATRQEVINQGYDPCGNCNP